MENGTYVARCYQMIDLGTQTETFQGEKPQTKRKVRLSFEMPDETYEFEKDGILEKRIRLASKEFALSMHEKATLRKFLANWRGKDFDATEAKKFDITKLLGVACLLAIEVNEKGYPDIKGASKIMKGQQAPSQVNSSKVLTFSDWDEDLFLAQPEFVRKKIEESPEYKNRKSSMQPHAVAEDEDENSLPF